MNQERGGRESLLNRVWHKISHPLRSFDRRGWTIWKKRRLPTLPLLRSTIGV